MKNDILSDKKILSGNLIKIIALIAMTFDHIGLQLFPQYEIFRIIGRLALPLYAYMITEGCKYTKNRKKYLWNVLSLAILCQVVYFVAEQSLYQCILVTFSLSICWIYVLDYAREKKNILGWMSVAGVSAAIWFVSVVLPTLMEVSTDFEIDYGFWGILLPVIIYFAPDKYKTLATLVALIPLCMELGDNQWYSLIAVLLLALYNGKRGKVNIKNLFYIYYPAHLVVIYLVSLFI